MKNWWCFIWCFIKIHPTELNGRNLLAFDCMNKFENSFRNFNGAVSKILQNSNSENCVKGINNKATAKEGMGEQT